MHAERRREGGWVGWYVTGARAPQLHRRDVTGAPEQLGEATSGGAGEKKRERRER